MDLTDEELELAIEHARVKRAFVEAKLAYLADPDDSAPDPVRYTAYQETKAAFSAYRRQWREVRDALKADATTTVAGIRAERALDDDAHREAAAALEAQLDGGAK